MVWRVRGRAAEVADAFALAAVEDVVGGTPWIQGASLDALAEGHVESVAIVASGLVWAHAAAGSFIEDLRSFAYWSLLAHTLALRTIKLLSCRANWSWVGAFALTCLVVESLDVRATWSWVGAFALACLGIESLRFFACWPWVGAFALAGLGVPE